MALRKPHVVANNRVKKAQKIEQILCHERPFQANDSLLEIGTGSGGIAQYFASETLVSTVEAVDVVDSRSVENSQFNFQLVDDVILPFNDQSFDVVISNHVIEHVGEQAAQIQHLLEIQRVLKPGGIVYLAVPNRWMLVEPHYKLIFLSWLPKRFRSAYLKKCRKVDFYDCEPLEKGQLERYLSHTQLLCKNYSIEAAKIFFTLEKPNALFSKILLSIPNSLLSITNALIPTLIYTLRKTDEK